MAGGIGSRFWPLSRNSRPKQFMDILGTGRTFLQMTYDRFIKLVPPENIMVVTSSIYGDLVKEQLPELDEENILCEPYRRNTAPCIAYAAYKLNERHPDAVVAVSPSDHVIMNDEIFLDTMENAFRCASGEDSLLTLGITPTRPETGYGYIQCNMGDIRTYGGHTSYGVKTFTEKPDAELARIFMESGEFLWNSGIFTWNLKTILHEMEKHIPEVSMIFREGTYYGKGESEFIERAYAECPSISIDYGVMEKTDRARVFKASFGWSDLGTWDSLYLHSDKDGNGNLAMADEKILYDVRNSIVLSKETDKLVVVKGLENYMVINTEDVLMICPRDNGSFKDMITDIFSFEEKSRYK